MKILITGSNGLLGQKLLHKLRVDNSVELIATSMGANRVSEQSNYKYLALDITSKQEVEKIILDEYASLQSDGITADELNRAKAQIKSEMAFSRDGSYSIASALNEAIAIGDWTFYTTYADNINSVKRSDVKAAAQKYFHEDQSTTGYFIPNSGADGDSDPGASGVHQPLHWRPESKNIP